MDGDGEVGPLALHALVRGRVTVLGTHKRGEPVLERHCQQPGEQLHAGLSDTELLEQLVPVAIEAAHRSLAANSVVPVSVFFGMIDVSAHRTPSLRWPAAAQK